MPTTPEPVELRVVRYRCPYCTRSRSKKAATVEHIARCWHNPETRACKTCVNYEPADPDGPYPEHPGWPATCGVERDITTGIVSACPLWQPRSKHVAEGGMTSGDCVECGEPWPCPTYAWATEDRDPLATWDPADDEPAPPEPTTVPCSRAVLKQPHLAHSWQPQPGMQAVLCNGVPAVIEGADQ
jgi:hypothetical protein